jgi:putative peptide zinc metalloprotease protein
MEHPVENTSALNACPKLRDDLVFHSRTVAGKRVVLVEDPITSKYFQLGLSEYRFVALLDGRTTISDALKSLAATEPDSALSHETALAVCRWLLENELANTEGSVRSDRLAEIGQARKSAQRWTHANLLFVRVPLFVPDRLLSNVYPWIAWLHTLPALLGALCVACWAMWIAASHWTEFLASARDVFSPNQRIGLIVSWLALKVLHEVSHGIACKKYGGYVRETGLFFVLFTPIPYVDVTSSWRFRSKWQRIHTAAAGIYLELIVASAAMICWSFTGDGISNRICVNLVVAGSLTTILFNANPLMRFDGYYILSDLLEAPNLYTEGQLYVRNVAARLFLGIRRETSSGFRSRPTLIRVYGIAAFCWRIVVFLGICVAAAALFHGAGLVLAAAALTFWIGLPLLRLAKTLWFLPPQHRWARFRCVAVIGCLFLGGAALSVVPWPGNRRAPAVVDYSPLTYVRTDCSGFVREVRVRDGQAVQAGEVLAVLENRTLEFEMTSLRLAVERSEMLCRQLQQKRKMSECQAEALECEALKQRERQLQEKWANLIIRAPINGTVIARNLDSRLGTYLADGDVICLLAREEQKEVCVSIDQDDVRAFAERVGDLVQVRTASSVFRGRFVQIDPKARNVPLHEALIATNHGPVAVRRHRDREGAAEEDETVELLNPRFSGLVEVPASATSYLACGERCTVSFYGHTESIGTNLYRLCRNWFERRWESHSR